MDISLQHRKILGFQLVQFSSLLLRVLMMLHFEFCYFYLVLVELFGHSICWLQPTTLSREARYKSRKITESLEIIRSKCNGSKLNINRDDGNFVKTNTWTPLLGNINDLESALRNQRSHCKADMTSY